MRVALLAFVTALLAAFLAPAAAQPAVTVASDMATLNYALALERLEAVYYNCYLSERSSIYSECLNPGRNYPQFTRGNFTTAGYNSTVYDALLAIADQEAAHVNLLLSVIRANQPNTGIAPVPRCNYQLAVVLNGGPITTVLQFLTVSANLENAGVAAYAGAVNTLTDTNLTKAAVQIADVEARHAAWLNQLISIQPFPSSGFDTANTPAQVVGALSRVFFDNVSCITASGSASDLPAVRPYGVAYSSANVSLTNNTGRLSQAAGLSYSQAQRANDINVLQYALLLENLEASFYNAAGAIFNQASFTANGLNASVYNNFVLIGLNENVHVAVLRNILLALGQTPAANCTYNFGTALGNFANYTATAALLENTGVYAYTAAARMITDTNLQQAAATIAMVEARHAGFLNVITARPANDTAAFPSALDGALEPDVIFRAVVGTGLVSNCPSLTLPVVLSNNAQFPSTGAGVFSSTGTGVILRGSSSSTGNGASSTASFSVMMLLAAIIASLALLL